jgi:hypothetical protein
MPSERNCRTVNYIALLNFCYLKFILAGEDEQDSFQVGAVFYPGRLKVLFQLIHTFVAFFSDFTVFG